MDLSHIVILQKNHKYLEENLQVGPVLDALYEKCVLTQADYDRCRQAGTEKCEMVLETLKKKGVEGYKTLCAVLDTNQPFIKERLDKTSTEAGTPDLVYVNKGKLEAQYKKELAKKDGEVADLKSSIEGLEQQIEQNHFVHAEVEERLKKEIDEHITEIEKKNEQIETLKTALSKSKEELQQSQAKCDKMEMTLREEQEAYDALVGVPRSQSPDRVDNTEKVQHGDLQKWNMQLTLKEENTRKVHEGRWHQLGEIIHRITAGTVSRTSKSQGLRPEQLTSQEVASEQLTPQEVEPEKLKSQDVFQAAKHFILGAFAPLETPERGLCLKGYSGTVHIRRRRGRSKFITCK
ncbi:calcium-binding and coiled-coil domain-containing protein 2-like isoform X6 [Haliotis rubra]|uniref:calcium-binding and coiled-coil domain-containing protein 2-like isoform X6 n=1 Tax=Haliotis rubra TaxID=36100 RepID=UPI001EE58289|nr:calcium-binding and coiled-coil domain-containing protein 2-like isoform X6 [Haliotis rubra]